jgi:hypothetical protein
MSLWTWMATLNWRGDLCDKAAMSMGLHLPRTTCREPQGRMTERPVRERGDSPREIISSVKILKTLLTAISQGECSEPHARAVPQGHGRKSVVRGLLRTLAPFLCLFLWVPPVLAMGEVYQWTDSRGVIHFTDNYQLVPEPLKDTPRLIVREDFLTEGELSGSSPQFENLGQGPVPAPQVPEVKRIPVPEPVRVVPQVIDNSQHYNTIVVVNSFATRQFAKSCLLPNGCRPVFRPNFRDRRYIHPSVFGRGSRQYIRPGSFQ